MFESKHQSITFTPCLLRNKNAGAFAAQKMKFSIKDFFSKCDQIRSFRGGLPCQFFHSNAEIIDRVGELT